ncbi:MAG TPA: hypothetical protein EYP19_09365, partial [Desulfobacterales bacterium]|nr:hypothetical protein [Desulfobacterales bacterium]
MARWQRSDLEAMVRALSVAAERSGLRVEDLEREGIGAATKRRGYLKHLCATGLLYLAQRRNKRRNEADVYLPLPSAEPIIRLLWKAEDEQDENLQRDLIGAACWAILYREPLWRIFTDIQVALFLGLLYHDHGQKKEVRHDLEKHPALAAVCLPFFAYAKDQAGRRPSDRLDASAYSLRKEAEQLFRAREFYGIFKQTAEAHGLRFGDWSVSWPRWRSFWVAANQLPVLVTGRWIISDENRRLIAAFLSLEKE